MRELKEKYIMSFENVKIESNSLCGLFQEFSENIDENISDIEHQYAYDILNHELDYESGWGYADEMKNNEPDKYDDYFYNTLLSFTENDYLDFFKEYFESNNLKLEITKVMSF